MAKDGFKNLPITQAEVPDFDHFGYAFFDGLRAVVNGFVNLDSYIGGNILPNLGTPSAIDGGTF